MTDACQLGRQESDRQPEKDDTSSLDTSATVTDGDDGSSPGEQSQPDSPCNTGCPCKLS